MSRHSLPPKGRNLEDLTAEMRDAHVEDLPVHHPRLFRPAYFAGSDVLDVGAAAFQMYYSENALYGSSNSYGTPSYPSVLRYQTELVGFLLDLLHAPDTAGGSITTGGTESNMMAVKTARDWARDHL